MLVDRCPICNTNGKTLETEGKEEDGIFKCPTCLSIFSEFGIVTESQKQYPEFWN